MHQQFKQNSAANLLLRRLVDGSWRSTGGSMTKELKFMSPIVVLAVLMFHNNAGAVTSPGWREMAVQVPDISLKSGVLAFIPIELKTVELDNDFPTDGGLFAISTVPGLSLVSAYAFAQPATLPPNTWTPIGEAEGFGTGSTPWNGHFNGVQGISIQKFAASFDGTAPNGTQGSIQIAVNEGGDVSFLPRLIGSINVYVGASVNPTWFRVTAAQTTISGNRVILNHPYLNGNPTANVFVAHVYNPPRITPMHWNHPVSVAYDSGLTRWTIQNDDSAVMVAGVTFNVRIDPGAVLARGPDWRRRGVVFQCLPLTHLTPIKQVLINHPSANNNPYATVIVTPRSADPTPLAVQFIGGQWNIVHTDGSEVPGCGVYNVQVIGFSEYFNFNSLLAGWLDPFVSNAAGMSIEGNFVAGPRNLPFWWQLGKPDEPIIVTPNLTPPTAFNVTAVADHSYVGVSYSGGSHPSWQIINEDGTSVPNETTFNTWGQPQLTP
jgi:hypothetical protein